MFTVLTKIIAKNPASILVALGGIGYLLGMNGAGLLLIFGILLNVGWLAKGFI